MNWQGFLQSTRFDRSIRKACERIWKYSEDQPRDYHGRWTGESAAAASEGTANAVFARAKQVFGTTNDPRKAGFVLPDGSMINLARKQDPELRYNHAIIGQVTEPKAPSSWMMRNDPVTPFLQLGAVRVSLNPDQEALGVAQIDPTLPQSGIMEIGMRPLTSAQQETLSRFHSQGTTYMSLANPAGHHVYTGTYHGSEDPATLFSDVSAGQRAASSGFLRDAEREWDKVFKFGW